MAIVSAPGWFYYEENNKRLGEVSYLIEEKGQVLALNHTYVDPSMRGQNIAQQLVDAVCDLARSKDAKVKPDCRYAAVLFRRFDEKYADGAMEAGPHANSASN